MIYWGISCYKNDKHHRGTKIQYEPLFAARVATNLTICNPPLAKLAVFKNEREPQPQISDLVRQIGAEVPHQGIQ